MFWNRTKVTLRDLNLKLTKLQMTLAIVNDNVELLDARLDAISKVLKIGVPTKLNVAIFKGE